MAIVRSTRLVMVAVTVAVALQVVTPFGAFGTSARSRPVPTSVTWSGKGTHVEGTTRVLDDERCDADSTPYLDWIVSASKARVVTITIGSTVDAPMSKTPANTRGAGVFKYRWMPGSSIDLDTLVASGVRITVTDARHRAVLNLVGGCLGGEADEPQPRPWSGLLVGWGFNDFGQLGNGSSTRGTVPTSVDLSGVLANRTITDVAVGTHHTCALADGQVACWGLNTYGALGDGTVTSRNRPVAVTGFPPNTTIVDIAAGAYHTCALADSGAMYCWGYNNEGQLGDGTLVDRWTPVPVTLPSGTATSMGLGGFHTCVSTSAGEVYCWGRGDEGQLGRGSSADSNTPIATITANTVSVSVGITSVTAGTMFTCALATTGNAYCWGYGGDGAIGNGSFVSPNVPTQVSPTTELPAASITSLVAGGYQVCARNAANAVFCWGLNTSGQLGDGTGTNRAAPVPVLVPDPSNPNVEVALVATSVAGGQYVTCAVTPARAVLCWGDNVYSQLGNGNAPVDSNVPTLVSTTGGSALTGPVDHVSAGTYSHHVLAW